MLARFVPTVAVSMVLAGALAPAAQAAGCAGTQDVPTTSAAADQAAQAVACLVNAERANRGLRPLRFDGDLAQAAHRHAGDMARRDYFSHFSPSGKSPGDRVRDAGYADLTQTWKVGEALAWGTGFKGTPQGTLNMWLASPEHRRILFETGYREIGVGMVTGTPLGHPTPSPGTTTALELGVIRTG